MVCSSAKQDQDAAGEGIKGSTEVKDLLRSFFNIQIKSLLLTYILTIHFFTCYLTLLQVLLKDHHVYFSLLPIPISANRLTASQRSWKVIAASTVRKAQSQLFQLQPVFCIATRTTRKCFNIWRGCLLKRFQPIWRQRLRLHVQRRHEC